MGLTAQPSSDITGLAIEMQVDGHPATAFHVQGTQFDTRAFHDGRHLITFVVKKGERTVHTEAVAAIFDNSPPTVEDVQIEGSHLPGEPFRVIARVTDMTSDVTEVKASAGGAPAIAFLQQLDGSWFAEIPGASQNRSLRITATDQAGNAVTWTARDEDALTIRPLPVPEHLDGVYHVEERVVELNWQAVALPDGARFAVLRTDPGQERRVIGTVDSPSYRDDTASPGVLYNYSVATLMRGGQIGDPSPVLTIAVPSSPVLADQVVIPVGRQLAALTGGALSLGEVALASTSTGGSITSDTTWTLAGSPYLVTSTVTVQAGATLTVEPGVIVKFNSGTGLVVKGTLQALGASGSEIIFTSGKDDANGGDTNGDGTATVPAAGNWTTIQADAGGTAVLRNARVLYGGSNTAAVFANGGTVQVEQSTVQYSSTRGVQVLGTGWVRTTTVSDFSTTGVHVTSGSPDVSNNSITGGNYGVYVQGGTPALVSNTIRSAASAGITLVGSSAPVAGTLTANNISASKYAVDISLTNARVEGLSTSGNQFAGNTYNGYGLGGTFSGTSSLPVLEYPYVMRSGTVNIGATLTVPAGAVIKVLSTNSLTNNGTLNLSGTSTAPVTFTSVKDDSVGGDTNGDGSVTAPVAGDWYCVKVNNGSATYAVFRYGGQYSSATVQVLSGTATLTNLQVITVAWAGIQLGSSATLSDSTLNLGSQKAVMVTGGAPIVERNTLTGSYGVWINGGTPTVRNNVIQDSPNGIYMDYLSTTATLTDNTITGATSHGIYVTVTNRLLSGLTVTGNTITNSAYAIRLYFDKGGLGSNTLEPNNIATGNSYNGYALSGVVGVSTALYPMDLPYIVPSLSINAGATLSVNPGNIIKLGGKFASIVVTGTLDVRGTSTQPVTFTAISDDVGWDTNGDGAMSTPAKGAWSHISLLGGGQISLDWAKVLYGDYTQVGAVTASSIASGSLRITNTEIAYSERYGAYLFTTVGTSSITIERSNLHHNGLSGAYLYRTGATISDNDITDQPFGLQFLTGSTAQILGNRLSRNGDGIRYSAYPPTEIDQPTIKGNSFVGNTNGIMNSLGDPPIQADHNWWGSDTGPQPIGSGDSTSGDVYVKPWMGQEYSLARQFGSAWWSRRYRSVTLPTGNYSHAVTDLAIVGGKGLPVQITRSYQSLNEKTGSFGIGWSFNFDYNLVDSGAEVLATYGSGQQSKFTRLGDGTYTAAAGDMNKLIKLTDGTFELTTKDRTVYRFDGAGKPIAIVDRNGNTVSLAYTGGALSSITDAGGRTFAITRDGANRITRIADPASQSVIYTYDSNGRLASVQDLLGGMTQYTYDTRNRLTTITAPNGKAVVNLSYDGNSQVSAITDALGSTTRFAYDLVNRSTTVTDARNGATTTTHDANLRVMTVKDPYDAITTTSYDWYNNVISVQDKNGGAQSYTYDSRNNLTSAVDPLGKATTYQYDGSDNLVKITDPRLNSTAMTYDGKGNLLTVTDALNKVTAYAYDPAGLPTSVTDPLQHSTTSTYDQYGNRMTEQNHLGHTFSYVYDILGRLTQVTDPLLRNAFAEYNAAGQVLRTTDHDLAVTESHTYDLMGRLTSMTDGAGGVTQYAYDDANRVVQVTDPRSQVTTFSYDPAGNRTGITNALNQKTTFEYDSLNRLTKVTLPGGSAYSYAFDAMGRMTSITDGLNHTRQMTYDADGRLTSEKDGALRVTQYSYDAYGNRTSLTAPSGGVTTYTYDALNRITEVAAPGATTVRSVFDGAGRQVEMVDSTGTTTFAYDDANRLLRKTVPDGRFIAYAYDAAGNITSITDFGGRVVTREYDKRNRLVSVTPDGGSATTYTYDGVNRWISRTDPNGVTAQVTRESDGGISAVQNRRADATVISSFQYTRDALGRVSSVVDAAGTTQYTYDVDGRLLTATEPDTRQTSYQYDGAGNRTSRATTVAGVTETTSYSYDASDRLATVTTPSGATVSYTHDADGNLLSDGTKTFAYDGFNQLLSAKQGTDTLATYSYDGTGLRVTKTTGAGTVRYYYDGDRIINEGDGTGITGTNVWGLDLIRRDQGGQAGYFLFNGHGDVVSVLDTAGVELSSYRYGPFGEASSSVGSFSNPYRYTSEPYDEETGFIYLRSRYYDPTLGRFVTQDTYKGNAWQPWTQNLYVYVSNNPVNFVDPTGHMIASVDDTGDSDTGLTLADIDNGIRDGLSDLEKPQFETCLGEEAKYGQPQAAGCYMLFGYRFGDGGEVARDQAAAEAQSQVFHGIGMASAAMAVPFKNGAWAKLSDVLTSAEQWLGRGYMEVEPGRFVSVDGTRQFRITSGDLTGHGGKQPPHANFETLVPNPAKSGKMMIDSNTHVYFFDP